MSQAPAFRHLVAEWLQTANHFERASCHFVPGRLLDDDISCRHVVEHVSLMWVLEDTIVARPLTFWIPDKEILTYAADPRCFEKMRERLEYLCKYYRRMRSAI